MEYVSATFNNNNTSLCGRDLKKTKKLNMIQQKNSCQAWCACQIGSISLGDCYYVVQSTYCNVLYSLYTVSTQYLVMKQCYRGKYFNIPYNTNTLIIWQSSRCRRPRIIQKQLITTNSASRVVEKQWAGLGAYIWILWLAIRTTIFSH